MIEEALLNPGMRAVCIREVQKSLKESAKRLIEDKLTKFNLGAKHGFKVLMDRIETPGNGVIIFQGMQDHTAESIKSLEGYSRAWIEEAQTLSARSLGLLRPTIRAEGSELWFSYNPTRKSDPVDQMFRGGDPPTDSIVIKANWSDNPWFPSVLEQERQDCLRSQPDQYPHIWEGDYATVLTGAYYAKHLAEARAQGRIGRVPADPLMTIRLFWDLGGRGARSDATSIWASQFIGREIRNLNYYEAVGQPLGAHVNWMRGQGYTPDRASIWLPHDGGTVNPIADASWESALREAGYSVRVVPNQGAAAAMQRVEAARRLFPMMWFNEETTRGGLDALGWYHERRDEARNIGLGPDHDWSSHAADAFGLMAVAYEAPREKPKPRERMIRPQGAWMA
jgi:phage terminase large subunit